MNNTNHTTDTNPIELLILVILMVAEAIVTLINLITELHATLHLTFELPTTWTTLNPSTAPTVTILRQVAQQQGMPRSFYRTARKAELLEALDY